ncbi:MAG: ATP-dependent DNA helicase [Clostridiaceae bacterium]|nr:ATP-dependent DNA helicase [Clostridiaceae bacterium]
MQQPPSTDRISPDPADSTLVPVKIAVRSLAEAVHRRGGLAMPLYGGVAAADGIRLHQRCVRMLSEALDNRPVQAEVALQQDLCVDSYQLRVSGRCDALVENETMTRIYEVKSFNGSASHLPPDGEPLHWAQARLYAWLYLADHPTQQKIDVAVVYIAQDNPDLVQHVLTCKRQDLERFFQDTCSRYIDFAANILRQEKQRLQSGLALRFPYADLRPGQKRMMQEVVGAARQLGRAFVAAPTGTGKTMAVLYPAVKVLANKLVRQVFYLTNMTSARLVAAQAMADLHAAGLSMKSLVLFAKEKLCLAPELYCDQQRCPFALAYYDHLPDALRQLFLSVHIGRDEILSCARQHRGCPFELSLDLALYCEIVICDYNYAFDPRVRLARFFGPDQTGSHLLLVDEAHNLPDRSRRMYSAVLSRSEIKQAFDVAAALSKQLNQDLTHILAWLDLADQAMKAVQPALEQVEKQIRSDAVMQADNFRAMRARPDELLARCSRFNAHAHLFLDEQREFPNRQILLKSFFSLLFFCRVAEEFYDDTYVTAVRQLPGGDLQVELMCLDAADKLAASYIDHHGAVFFSATLAPLSYYVGLIQGHHRQGEEEALQLGSPFPPDNLLVLICSGLSVRYKQRQDTAAAVLSLLLTAVRQKTGNYLVFAPSHAYVQMLRALLRSRPDRDDFDYMFQVREMNESMRQKYLRRFDHFGSRTLLAFAVIGGVFGEGIDLVGEKLAGVVVIGVGLPQLCPEREIMKQYYAQALGSGYEYAYLYPGFNKVQQAAGRVIRSDLDRGFVLLIDDRYATPDYRSLFPAEWQPVDIADEADAAREIQAFWSLSPDPQP